jgi:protein-tyrosine phosphatase
MFLDIHSHMLPGLDDGASDWKQSLAMASMAIKDGISGVVCTPHWVLGRYENTRPTILHALEKLREKLSEHAIPLKVYPGAELRLDVNLSHRIRTKELLTINDTERFALTELPEDVLPQNLEKFFWDLQVQKITPIISHPERNPVLLRNPMRLYDWVQMGVLAQLTAASLLGHFGPKIRKFSALLLEHNLVHVLATDAHGLSVRIPKLSEAYKVIEGMKGKKAARDMACETPKRIIQGKPVSTDEPIPVRTRSQGRIPWKRFSSFFKVFIMIIVLSACSPAWGPPIREIKRPSAPAISSKSKIGTPKSEIGNADVREIETDQISKLAEEKLIKLKRQELSRKDYILEKFEGKKVVFPQELEKVRPERPVYRIGVEDELSVLVWQNPDLSMDVIVRDDGKISLPLVGEVEVAGLQVPELESLLERKYAKYVKKPQVTVTVKAVNSLKVFITGAVRVPWITAGPLPTGFPLRGDKRLLTALSQVEILPEADLSEAYIVRGEAIIPLALNRLLKDGDMTQNVLLKPADTIVIPALIKEVVVLGEVNQPGRHKVKRRTTVLDAIAVARGIKRATAVLHMAYVARRGSILPINFKRLIDMGNLDQNILLEDNDVIYLPSSQDNKVFIFGEVRRPGVVRFVEPMDVVEAISEAGDFQITANRGQVVVVRGVPHQPKVYAINTLKMIKGYTAERFLLDRRDIVYVPRTAIADWNVFISQLLPTITAINLGTEAYERLE